MISDAFERASIGSDLIFGKARLQFVVQNEALESFFRPAASSTSVRIDNFEAAGKKSLALVGKILRWAALVVLIASGFISEWFLGGRAYTIIVSLVNKDEISDSWVSVALIFVFSITLSVAVWIMLRIALREMLAHCSPKFADNRFGDHKGCTYRVNQWIASVLFGLGPSIAYSGAGEDPDEWHGRMAYLESQMERLILSAKTDLKDEMTAMEMRLNEKLLESKVQSTGRHT